VASLIIWSIAYLALAAYPVDFPCILARAACWLLAIVALLTVLVFAAVKRSKHALLLAIVLLAAGACQWFFAQEIALRARLALIRPSLEASRARFRAGEPTTFRAQSNSIRTQGDPTSLGPVAFVDGGMLDNWAGFVFDPASAGLNPPASTSLTSAARQHPVPPTFRAWFGGDMTYAIPLGNGWFYCWFT
jgi:hypothetical protein